MPIRSLRLRLLLTFSLVLLVAIGTVALYVRQSTVHHFQRYVADVGLADQKMVSTLLNSYAKTQDPAAVQALVEQFARASGRRIIFLDRDRRVIADSEYRLLGQVLPAPAAGPPGTGTQRPLPGPLAEAAANGAAPSLVVMQDGSGGTGRIVAARPAAGSAVAVANREAGASASAVASAAITPALPGQLGGAAPAGPAEGDFVAAVNRSLLLAGLLGGGLAALLTGLLSARILRPVRALTAAAGRLGRGDLSQRVPVQGADELGQLAGAFNAMADSLTRSEGLRRRLVGDVAHDLRTPLTNIRGYLEALEDGILAPGPAVLASLQEEALLLNRLVDDLQELALAEAGQLRLEPRPVDLATLVEQTALAIRLQAERKGLELRLALPPGLPPAQADPERLAQILRNLLANAFAHTPAGGRVVVSAAAAGPELALRVRDSGEGIAPEHLPYVFERFYRADPARARATGGSGLGLAIVKQLVQQQGGRVAAESAPGAGSVFPVTLPVAGAPAERPSCPASVA